MEIRKELTDQCRYYKENSQEPPGGDEQICWVAERAWIQRSMEDHEDDPFSLDEYMAAGLGDFQNYDGISITYKSFLFAFICKLNDRVDKEAFKEFYLANYS